MSNSKKSAFPYVEIKKEFSHENGHFETKINHDGLTKREYFAAMALQGLLASPGTLDGSFEKNAKTFSQASVILADELLKQLDNG